LTEPKKESASEKKPITFDNYSIIKTLGHGSFSVVYLAEQLSTKQKVAIKLLKESEFQALEDTKKPTSGDSRIARFKREMRLCVELSHPNIISVVDFGKSDCGRLFTVFEYIPGKTLAQLIKDEGALSIKRTKALMGQLLAALCAARNKSIVHRDLKPENIMITTGESGDILKVLDFGISTFSSEESYNCTRVTMTREFLRTPAYASPEQLRGERVNAATDIFAWGLIFIECLNGQTPYHGLNTARLVQRQLSAVSVPIPSVLFDHPLASFLDWVLQKDVRRRATDAVQVIKRYEEIDFSTVPQDCGFIKAGDLKSFDRYDLNRHDHHSRRHLTVLCCDLYIENAEQCLTETCDQLFHDTMEKCLELSQKNGAYVVGSFGGRLMLYFGYPIASDSSVRTAAATALEISASLLQSEKQLQVDHKLNLNWHMALHSGEVEITDAPKPQVYGITPSHAARLCSLSPKGSIYTTAQTFEFLMQDFKLTQLALKAPFQKSYVLNGLQEMENLEALLHTAIIGRTNEIDELRAIKEKSKHDGQLVLLTGEAGIGKSRLIAEVFRDCEAPIELKCSPENKNSALAPFLNLLNNYFKLSEFSQNKERDDFLNDLLEYSSVEAAEYLPLLYRWTGLESSRFLPLEIAPIKQNELFLQHTATLFFECILQENHNLVIEDLHWIDPSSQELLDLILAQAVDYPVFILMSSRPDFTPSWGRNITTYQLEGLLHEGIEALVRHGLEGITVDEDLIKRLIDKVDGNPLFAEELIRSLKGELNCDNQDSVTQLEIPHSLKDLLTGRLDKMGMAKHTAQLASVLGRSFNYELLAQIFPNDEGVLLADLNQLLAAELIHVVRRPDTLEYIFHHALVRDNAYSSMNTQMCQEIHAQVAGVLEESLKKKTNLPLRDMHALVVSIAYHYATCGNAEKALAYNQRAAEDSLQIYAYKEATTYLETALSFAITLEGDKYRHDELDILISLGMCLKTVYGWDHKRAKEIYHMAIDLSETLGGNSIHKVSPIMFARWAAVMMNLELQKALELAKHYLEVAKLSLDEEILMQAHMTLANNFYWLGDLEKTQVHLNECFSYYNDLDKTDLITKHGMEPITIAHMFHVFCHWHAGRPTEATEALASYMTYVESLNHPFSLAIMLQASCWHYYHEHNEALCLQSAQRLISLSEEYNFSFYKGIGKFFRGWVSGLQGNYVDGLTEINEAYFKLINPNQGKIFNSVYICATAEVMIKKEDHHQAQELLLNGLLLAKGQKENCYLSELHRLIAICKYHTEGKLQSHIEFENSLSVARAQGMKSFELRTALEKAKLLEQNDESIQSLQELVNSFSQFDGSYELLACQELLSTFEDS